VYKRQVYIYQIPAFFPLKHIGYFFIPLLEAIRLKKKSKTIDVFYLHVSYPFSIFTFLLDFFKIKKWILMEHWSGYTNYDHTYDTLSALTKFLIKNRLKKFNPVNVVSEFLKKAMYQRFPFLEKKILTIYNVVHFPMQLNNKKIEKEPFRFLTISNLVNHPKNISFLIKVMDEARKHIPSVQLDIYGDGKDKEILIQEAEKSGLLNKHIFFKGKVENEKISDVYTQYHAFILLSKFETFSVVTAEAIAHGLPVIVTKCGAPEEYVNPKNGFLVPIDDLKKTVDAILQLYNTYDTFVPETIQSTVREKFSREAIPVSYTHLTLPTTPYV